MRCVYEGKDEEDLIRVHDINCGHSSPRIVFFHFDTVATRMILKDPWKNGSSGSFTCCTSGRIHDSMRFTYEAGGQEPIAQHSDVQSSSCVLRGSQFDKVHFISEEVVGVNELGFRPDRVCWCGDDKCFMQPVLNV
eukprot:Gb_29271 [translate_table: standard]